MSTHQGEPPYPPPTNDDETKTTSSETKTALKHSSLTKDDDDSGSQATTTKKPELDAQNKVHSQVQNPEAEDAMDSTTFPDAQILDTQKINGTNAIDSHVASEKAASSKHSTPPLGKDRRSGETATEGIEASSSSRGSKSFFKNLLRWRKKPSVPIQLDVRKNPTGKVPVLNLVEAEYNYIVKGAKKLNEYNHHLDSAVEEATKNLTELKKRNKNEEDEDLKKLRKAMVKLKLQIPLSVYDGDADEADPLKKLKFAFKLAQEIPEEVLKVKPQLHKNDAFENGVEFKDFETRYNQLSSNELKLCLLCFSIFPGNVTIKKRLMVQWWVCEGFTKDEKTANQYFIKLIEYGFIEPVNKNKSKSIAQCQMHPFYRSALAVIAKRVQFFNFDDHGEPTQDFSQCFQSCLVGDGLISYDYLKNEFFKPEKQEDGSLENLEGSQKNPPEGSQKKAAAVSLLKKSLSLEKPQGSKKKPATDKSINLEKQEGSQTKSSLKKSLSLDKPVENASLEKFLDQTLEKVHLLFNVKETTLEFKDGWFSKMKNVNFIQLGSWRTTDHIEVDNTKFLEDVGPMNYLKFLSLQGVSNVIQLPESITQFQNLKFLDLRACHNLEKIPEKIGMLRNLQHLDMSECYLLNHMPKSLSELSELQVLKGFVVVTYTKGKGKCTLEDLKKLEKLEKLCIYTGLSNFPKDEDVGYLSEMTSLRKLTITWGGNVLQKSDEASPDGTHKLPSQLEKLDLKCFPNSKTPKWLTVDMVSHLTSLKKLYIRGGKFSDLGQYQEAEKSNLVQPNSGENRCRWATVEELRLKYLSRIDMEWGQLQELFPKLEYLEQVHCPKLAFFPCDANGVWTKNKQLYPCV